VSAIWLSIRRFIVSFWRILGPRQAFVYHIERVDELPDSPRSRTIYCLGEHLPWSAVLLCPCGCRAPIHLSLLPEEEPSWQLTISQNNIPTLTPSVWRTEGCKSHFWVNQGKVTWCRL
jgi:hypothetical protein